MTEIRVATWNVEWRRPDGADGKEIHARIEDFGPDIVCLTETHVDFLESWGGFAIASPIRFDDEPWKRSVVLWSRCPWSDVDAVGLHAMPQRRYLTGATNTAIGTVRVVGIIIPYHMADVRACGCRVWQRHRDYLTHLPQVLDQVRGPSIVLGDFNQRIPSSWVPRELQNMLQKAFHRHTILTTQLLGPDGQQAIDHIAISQELQGDAGAVLSNERLNGGRLSDHFGVTATVTAGDRA